MTERSRRQVLVDIAAAIGALLLSATVRGRFGLGQKRPAAPGRLSGAGAPAVASRRVKPAPHSVKRDG